MPNSSGAEKPARVGRDDPGAPPDPPVASASSGRTAWLGRDTPLRRFLRTETGSGAVLVGAAVAGLIWANLDYGSYQRVWNTLVSVRVGQWDLSLTLRQWINSGLMAFFFLVVGLEARREFDVGEFRERPRIVLPVVAGLGGMLGAIGIYLAVNAGRSSIHGWGVSMSTDTAFALGVFALLGSRVPNRLRGLILTVTVVDDIVGLVVIATVYSHHLSVAHLLVAAGAFATGRRWPPGGGFTFGLVYFALAAISWVALAKSGVDPIIVGLAAGLIAYAAPANRPDLERATSLVRDFREQPTPGRAQLARAGLATAISPNDRLAQIYHPWTSYVIVPLFGLANAGIPIDAKFLASAYRSPVTLGIILGYVIGKPLGVTLASALVTKASRGRLRPPVGWAAVIGGGATAGTGFTVSLLIASIAFRGSALKEATLGILTAAVLSAVLAWLVFAATAQLPPARAGQSTLGPLGGHRRSRRSRRRRSRPPARPARRPDHPGRIRRLPMPPLRRGRTHHPGTPGRLRRPALRVAAPTTQRRTPPSPTGRRSLRGGRDPRGVLADARPPPGTPRPARIRPSDRLRPAARTRHRSIRHRPANPPLERPGRRRRGKRRPQRRLWHTHLLHQRPTPTGTLRHRHPQPSRPKRTQPSPGEVKPVIH